MSIFDRTKEAIEENDATEGKVPRGAGWRSASLTVAERLRVLTATNNCTEGEHAEGRTVLVSG
jgi:hypothetical protein